MCSGVFRFRGGFVADRRQLAEEIPIGLDIILDQVVCVGNEPELSDCTRNDFGNALGCRRHEAAACLCIDGMCSDN